MSDLSFVPAIAGWALDDCVGVGADDDPEGLLDDVGLSADDPDELQLVVPARTRPKQRIVTTGRMRWLPPP
jgi:hypothetical protein